MVRNNVFVLIVIMASVLFYRCSDKVKTNKNFYELKETVLIDNWQFDISVEEQKLKGNRTAAANDHFLKATLFLSNKKTKKSLLYSISDDQEDYEAKYKYLSFGSKGDLYIKYKNEYIYALGYVFEPSNGLSTTERLVYKFKISNDMFEQMSKDNQSVEYWYIDRLVGLGKICFTHNN